ncbi:MAG TPA: hypothetical protein VGC98_08660 [Thermoleophilaceae bacterium]
MRMLAAAIAFLLAMTLGSTAAGKGGGCASAGRTVIKGSVARVYEQSPRVYVCWLPKGRRVRMDGAGSRWRLANVKGPYAAVAFDRTGSAAELVWVKLGESTERHVAYTFPEGGPHPPAEQLYVSPRGAVAFSTPSAIGYVAPQRAGGEPRYEELDAGSGLAPESLWANNDAHRLYWRNDGVRKSAPWR